MGCRGAWLVGWGFNTPVHPEGTDLATFTYADEIVVFLLHVFAEFRKESCKRDSFTGINKGRTWWVTTTTVYGRREGDCRPGICCIVSWRVGAACLALGTIEGESFNQY